ncbi:LacI family transcriptional regulator [Rummeliibacillus sp. TYF005]|uniref:LacI family DNA-binding transcriptional regulator n=1 Tax=unclassified Rummeliibacillus TaxID=2622809 RepID=UPI000E660D2F|nr:MULTISPECIES: LacI family DNA-binding transcriptional regulator [unclassified Rummeliibacillus]RIJ64262.1 LacI family transcriptional regulator [Rummeliibacillus sp. POC4]RPJ94750.1 LacI family transcriptional regulator [Rummeliibacillus sp. TYF005]
MAVTIIDVAKEANVSPSTVSRVIADSPRISVQTKRRVREVMERLKYYPNFQARNLAAKRTNTIGVIMSHSTSLAFQNPFFPEVIRGICSSAHSNQYGIYLSTGGTEEEIYKEVVSMVQGKKVDGIILLYSRVNDRTMAYLKEVKFPFTMVGRPYENEKEISYIDNDNKTISKNMVNYLEKLGHQHIAFVGGDIDFVVSLDRLEGYKQGLKEKNLYFIDEYFIRDEDFKTKGIKSIQELMKLDMPPTAIIAHDDLVAYEIIRYLEDLSINVPEDISIVSFNNHALSEYVKPPLTTVDISIFELGFEAANYLYEQVGSDQITIKHHFVPTTLIERNSCKSIKFEK